MIEYILQPTCLICGQACIAMLANISIEEAINKMGTDGSTEPVDIINDQEHVEQNVVMHL